MSVTTAPSAQRSPIAAVAIVRDGTALGCDHADGSRSLLRRCDLDFALGHSDWRSPRFVEAAVGGDHRLTLADADGVSVTLDAAEQGRAMAGGDLLIHNARNVVRCAGDDLAAVESGAVVIRAGRILWVGKECDLASSGVPYAGLATLDAQGALVTPGLIDCHAHPIFAGHRADELARRARGENYLDIARDGGGIAASVRATRQASVESLLESTATRARRALAHGTTTLEAKSGYDLTVEGELRLLEIARMVDALGICDLSPTLLGAHSVPSEYADRRDAYVDAICEEMIPRARARDLCEAVDVYCDQGAFTRDEMVKVLTTATAAGLRARAHVGQFADIGGAEAIAGIGGLSVDHLEQVNDDAIAALAAADVVAVMLPAACVQLGLAPPPVARLRQAGVKLAVASDFNPGTSYCQTLALPMWLAVTHYRMTVEEAWLGVTRYAAMALGRPDVGVLAPGYRGDLVLWDATGPADIPYAPDRNFARQVVKDGRPGPWREPQP